MSTESVRQLLDLGFYEHNLDDLAVRCERLARGNTTTVEYFALAKVFGDLRTSFHGRPILTSDAKRLKDAYTPPILALLDAIDGNLPAPQVRARLEELIRINNEQDYP